MIMTFSENILDHIEVYGGSEGQYIPDSISNDIKSKINYSSDKITYMLNTRVTLILKGIRTSNLKIPI